MAKTTNIDPIPNETLPSGPPAMTPGARENQMVDLAVAEAERRMRDGTASSQIIVHYLKLATAERNLELEALRQEVELKKAKIEALKSGAELKEMYVNAIAAMRNYSGHGDADEYPDVF